MDEIRTDAELTKRVRGGMSAAEMGDNKMTYEESIHKMLERILKNQIVLFAWVGGKEQAMKNASVECVRETDALLKQVKA